MIDLKRRTALHALMAVATATTLPGTTWATNTPRPFHEGSLKSVVGFGGAGGTIVRRFVEQHPGLARHHLISIANRPQNVAKAREFTHEDLEFEFLNKRKHNGMEIPLLVVAGLGGIAGGDLSHAYVAHLREAWPGLKVGGLLCLPFEWESRRNRALRQAENLIRILGDTVVIDLESLARQSSPDENFNAFLDRADQSAGDQIVRILEGPTCPINAV